VPRPFPTGLNSPPTPTVHRPKFPLLPSLEQLCPPPAAHGFPRLLESARQAPDSRQGEPFSTRRANLLAVLGFLSESPAGPWGSLRPQPAKTPFFDEPGWRRPDWGFPGWGEGVLGFPPTIPPRVVRLIPVLLRDYHLYGCRIDVIYYCLSGFPLILPFRAMAASEAAEKLNLYIPPARPGQATDTDSDSAACLMMQGSSCGEPR
jgi:hypothetical protein